MTIDVLEFDVGGGRRLFIKPVAGETVEDLTDRLHVIFPSVKFIGYQVGNMKLLRLRIIEG